MALWGFGGATAAAPPVANAAREPAAGLGTLGRTTEEAGFAAPALILLLLEGEVTPPTDAGLLGFGGTAALLPKEGREGFGGTAILDSALLPATAATGDVAVAPVPTRVPSAALPSADSGGETAFGEFDVATASTC